jgi:hypothetical protein
LLLAVVALADILDEGFHKLRPLVAGYLDRSDGGNKLSDGGTDLLVRRGQCTKSQLLDLLLDLRI